MKPRSNRPCVAPGKIYFCDNFRENHHERRNV
jgi:hypothetical protein